MKKIIREAYAEIDILMKYIPKEYKDQVPIELQNMFKNKKSLEYRANIDINNPLNKAKLKRETLVILAILQYNFWHKTNKEKEDLKKLLEENERKRQDRLKEEYNIDNLFKNKKYDFKKLENTNLPIPINKKSFYQKIVDYIKNIFKNNREEN